MVRDFQRMTGRTRRNSATEKRLPDALFACVGGGSNAIGMFHAFTGDESVKLIGLSRRAQREIGRARRALSAGHRECCTHAQLCLQDADGQCCVDPLHFRGLD